MARSAYIYYAQHKDHPSDPAYSAAFTVKHELAAWLGERADSYQLWRMPDGGSWRLGRSAITAFTL
jgi:hypothetical protein